MKGELDDLMSSWKSYKDGYMNGVHVPVLAVLGEFDWIWVGSRDNIERFCVPLTKSPRVESAIISGAPHALEWWNDATAWWLRIAGWSAEVSTGLKRSRTF